MLPPLPRCSNWVSSSLISPSCISLPRFHCRVGLHIVLFEDCSAFTHVAACTLAQSPYIVTAIRGLQTFRHLHACPGCFRRERSPGGRCTHLFGAFPVKAFFGLLSVLCSERESGSSSRRLRSGLRSARKGSRDRNASRGLAACRLAGLVFRSALTPEHAQRR